MISSSFEEFVSQIKNGGENLIASWLQNIKVAEFNTEKHIIKIIMPVDFSFFSQKEFVEKVRVVTGNNWVLDVVDPGFVTNADAVISIKEKKLIEIENRKKEAINSPIIKQICNEFKGAEIISVA